MEQSKPPKSISKHDDNAKYWEDKMSRMHGDLLRTFAPHFLAGLADYQVQAHEDAQRESYTLVEDSGETPLLTDSSVSNLPCTNAIRGSRPETRESMSVADSITIERNGNHFESGNEITQRLHEKDTQIQELRNLNEKLRSLNEHLKDELNAADMRIDEMEELIEKLKDDLILGTKTPHR